MDEAATNPFSVQVGIKFSHVVIKQDTIIYFLKTDPKLENNFFKNISISGYSGWLGGDVVRFGSRYSDAST